MLLPTLMLLLAMLVQPACLLYTRCVMHAAAAEACRLMATSSHKVMGSGSAYTDYVLRRLAAVPDLALFHEGGRDGWEIELEGSSSSGEASAHLSTRARPLPFLGAAAALMGQGDGQGNVVLDVEVHEETRPEWVEGGYDAWASIW